MLLNVGMGSVVLIGIPVLYESLEPFDVNKHATVYEVVLAMQADIPAVRDSIHNCQVRLSLITVFRYVEQVHLGIASANQLFLELFFRVVGNRTATKRQAVPIRTTPPVLSAAVAVLRTTVLVVFDEAAHYTDQTNMRPVSFRLWA